MSLSVLIAAGGTGGHMIPADALATELQRRGHRVTLLADARGMRFPGLFKGVSGHILESATASGLNPFRWLRALIAIFRGRQQGIGIARDVKADAVVGFGGYPSLPGLLAGVALGLPSILHEQNAVLGRVNRRLQGRVSAVALSYRQTANLSPVGEGKAKFTGNPVRPQILAAREQQFQAPLPDVRFQLLVVGGSQGARLLSELVPQAILSLDEAHRRRLKLVQQCRPEDLSAASLLYQQAGIDAECLPYFEDFPQRLADAHLVISRAGASTMAELMAVGRPAILIPYAAATDDHQAANAREYVAAGAGFLMNEAEATVAKLAGLIRGFLESPESLQFAATAARAQGVPDAAARLADLVEHEVASV